MIRYIIVIMMIILYPLSLASAATFNQNEVQWAPAVTGTLYKGNTLTNGPFMVKAVQFTSPVHGVKDINGNIVPETDVDPSVMLEVYKNGILIKETVLSLQSEAFIDDDYEVMVSATAFTGKNAKEWVFEYYNPFATIAMAIRGKPKLEVTIATDKSTYTSNSDQAITATVTVKNSGDAKAKNVDINLGIGDLNLRGGDTSQLHKYYYIIEKGASQSFDIVFSVPQLIDEKTYSLKAVANAIDIKELGYNAETKASITVSPKQNYFSINKAVSKDRIYLQNTIIVRLTAANGGMYDIYNIHVTDSMNENFELKSNTTFQWDIPVLKPGQEWGTTYNIKPFGTNINGFILPVASAQFTVNNKPYSASSPTVKVIVNGPKIVLNKNVDKTKVNLSNEVKVTVSVNNAGNIATKAEVTDSLPDGVSFVSGTTNLPSTFLELNTPQVFSYSIKMNRDGQIELPAAVANYTDIASGGSAHLNVSSGKPVITVIDPGKITPAPTSTEAAAPIETPVPLQETTHSPSPTKKSEPAEPTPTPITPGFNIVLAIIVLIITAVFRRK